MENVVVSAKDCQDVRSLNSKRSDNHGTRNKFQQPGQYLCVDTRKEAEQVRIAPEFRHKSAGPTVHRNRIKREFQNSRREQLSVCQDSAVQPDSLCKFKSLLAINYVRDILEAPEPAKVKKSSKQLKKGRLKPLLNVNLLKEEPKITRCLGIQNDRQRRTVIRDDGARLPLEAFSPASARFSSAVSGKDKVFNIDMRKMSLVDQSSDATGEKFFEKYSEKNHCEQHRSGLECDFAFNNQQTENFSGGNAVEYEADDNGHENIIDNNDGGIDDKIISSDGCLDQGPGYEDYLSQRVKTSNDISGVNQDSRFVIASDKSSASPPSTSKRRLNIENCHNTTPGNPALDNIQVKDIWRALNDSGYNISREEVSRYKHGTKKLKERIGSAPARRKTSEIFSSLKVLPRARSAVGKTEAKHLDEERSIDLAEKGLTDDALKSLRVGGFLEMENSGEKGSQEISRRENLEVIAVSKPVSMLPRRRNVVQPPLNFKINTRPKPRHFFYFAYGFNMNQKRLEIQLRCKTGERYWGLLFGFKLIFNKKGSSEGDVGFPNVAVEPGYSVEGCIYELSCDYLPLLDTCVGFPTHYSRLVLPVWLCNSSKPADHGVAQHCVPAVVYIAQNDWVVSDPATLDTAFTMKQCLLGTDILTPNYKEFLSSLMKQ